MGAFHGVCRGGGGSVFVRLLAITLYPRMSWRRAVRSALRHHIAPRVSRSATGVKRHRRAHRASYKASFEVRFSRLARHMHALDPRTRQRCALRPR